MPLPTTEKPRYALVVHPRPRTAVVLDTTGGDPNITPTITRESGEEFYP